MEIEYRTETILEVKKCVDQMEFDQAVGRKCQVLDIGVQRFFNKLEVLYKKGLPSLLVMA